MVRGGMNSDDSGGMGLVSILGPTALTGKRRGGGGLENSLFV